MLDRQGPGADQSEDAAVTTGQRIGGDSAGRRRPHPGARSACEHGQPGSRRGVEEQHRGLLERPVGLRVGEDLDDGEAETTRRRHHRQEHRRRARLHDRGDGLLGVAECQVHVQGPDGVDQLAQVDRALRGRFHGDQGHRKAFMNESSVSSS
ncbi:hypothetical protein [Pseudonocardia sp. Ae406_Ps2]|uniref:hypothetical protein n=1 Tax=Pseudonocardia sp. Ae406_Ps2 TaxID=1885033 RepID=UPI0024B36B94|nr:hypothetical protein [Pseudonocardia sp. Ae406_Ps2]